jgi:hypothetical protein
MGLDELIYVLWTHVERVRNSPWEFYHEFTIKKLDFSPEMHYTTDVDLMELGPHF